MRILSGTCCILLLALAPLHAVNWTETLDGDLSNLGSSPTPITLSLGVNTISGTMGRDLPSDPVDRDIFTFTLAPGQVLTSIDFTVFTPTNQSFYALGPGSTINTEDPATHLANTLIKDTGETLFKLVQNIDSQGGGTWPSLPIGSRVVAGPGTYTVWFQELSSVVTYSTAYTVVPEPSTWLAVLGGLGMLFAVRKRRSA